MRNVLRKSYGVGGALLTPMPIGGTHMMGTDGRIYYAYASSGNEVVPPGVKLFRMATAAELDTWRRANGAKGQPATPFDVRAEVQAYEKNQAAALMATSALPNMGTTSNEPAPMPAAQSSFGIGAIAAVVLIIIVMSGKR